MAKNKVIFGDEVIIDLTLDDVTVADVAKGKKFHLPDGETAIGTSTKDADTSDADAIAGDIISGKTAYVQGSKIEGTMPIRGAVQGKISDKDTPYQIQAGYHDGTGTVGIDDTELAKLIAGNIKSGVEILGVTGNYAGEMTKGQTKSVVAYTNKDQSILPDEGYDFLAQVNVAKIKYEEAPNSAGGVTVTIGEVSPT